MRNLSLGRVGELAIFVGVLALGKPVLVPLALAFYLAFILSPPSNWLERFGMPRAVSVATVVAGALTVLVVLGGVLVAQAADLTRQMRSYTVQMSQKLSGLRSGKLGEFGDLSAAFSELGRALDPAPGTLAKATAVKVVAGDHAVWQRLEAAAGPLLQPFAIVVIVFVMAIFMLAHREDLRGRLIQLVGPENVTVTTRTMGEAVNRVSRLLLTQIYINTGLGVVITLGLYCLGVPYSLLWGSFAALLRFVPLLGSVMATLPPTLVAFAVFPGWSEALFTAGLFVVAEMAASNFIEPLVLGKRTGVSALALLISSLFWTWLWGPAGLLLATPLTVCAAVVGRHVPQLAFLAIALGDEADLNAAVNFYQRTLAKATKDAYRLAKRMASESSLEQTFDELLVPALGLVTKDLNVRAISQDVADRVVADVGEIAARLGPETAREVTGSPRPRVLGIAAESSADGLLLRMLRIILAARSANLTLSLETDRDQSLAAALRERPERVCIAASPPSGNVNARFLCRRLRAELPDTHIIVLLPGTEATQSKEAAARLREAGANSTTASLREASRLLLGQEPSAEPELPA